MDAAPEPKRSRRRLRTRLGLSLGVLLLTLFVAEAASRLFLRGAFLPGELRSANWKVCGCHHAERGWANLPRARARITKGEIDYRVRINSSGWRDPERTIAPRAGVRRVVLLGDSVAWGWGVDDGERFSDLLEQRLGAEIEVLNLAVPGYGTDQEYWTLLETGFAYAPDAVMLCLVYNDFFEVESAEAYDMPKPRFIRDPSGWRVENRPVHDRRNPWKRRAIEAWRRVVSHSALLTWILHLRAPPAHEPPVEQRDFPPMEGVHVGEIRERCDELVQDGSVIRMLFERIQQACAERSTPLLVFSVVHHHDEYLYEPRAPRPPIEDQAGFTSHLALRLAQAGEELGFATVSVDAEMLQAVGRGERLHCGDGHLNERGNAVVADVLEPRLRELLRR